MSKKITLLAATAALALSFGAAHATDWYDSSSATSDGAGFSGGVVGTTPNGWHTQTDATGVGYGDYSGQANAGTGYANGKVNTNGYAGVGVDSTGYGAAGGVFAGGGAGSTYSSNDTGDGKGGWTHNDASTSAGNLSAGAAGSIGNGSAGTAAKSGAGASASSNGSGTSASAGSNGASNTGASSSGGGLAGGASAGGGASSASSNKSGNK